MDACKINSPILLTALKSLKVHQHLCLFYQTREEQLAASIPFICLGLQSNQRCLYMADEASKDEIDSGILAGIQEFGLDAHAALATGSLAVLTRETYLRDGRFDPERMIAFLGEATSEAIRAGYSALRATDEMTWAWGDVDGAEGLIEYEARLNEFLSSHDCLALCQYDRRRFPAEIVRGAIHTHPLVIQDSVVAQNFHYISPDVCLGGRQDEEEVERLLSSIIEREKAERALRENQALLQAVLNETPDPVFVKDRDSRMLLGNPAVFRAIGRPAEEIIGKKDCEFYADPAVGLRMMANDRRIMETGRSEALEEIVPMPDGDHVFLSTKSPYRDAEGNIIGVIGIARDITDRKRVEEGLKQSLVAAGHNAAETDAIFAAMNDVMLMYDTERKVRRANPAFRAIYGFDPIGLAMEELARRVSCRWLDGRPFILEDQPTPRALRGEKVSGAYYHVARADGTEGVVETWSGPMCVDGQVIGSVAIWHDVTSRTQAEEALRASEEKFSVAFDRAPVLMSIRAIEDGAYVNVNSRFVEVSGFSRKEAIGRTSAELGWMTSEDHCHAIEALQKQGRMSRTELSFRAKDGRQVICLCDAEIIVIGGGPCVLFIGVDITDFKRHQAEREAILSILRLANAPGPIHDLVQAVTGFLQEWSTCEAVGVRLRKGDDFPYHETRGFPQEFVRAENSLCVMDASQTPARDNCGNPELECMCGNILCGRFDPSKPFFTEHGSFWTNSTSELLASTSEADRQARTRNRCNGEGYESVALIPLRTGGATFGLLQFNDRRKGRLTLETIQLLERLGDNVAIALAQRKAEQALLESERLLKQTQKVAKVGGWEYDVATQRISWTDEVYHIYEVPADYDANNLQEDIARYVPQDRNAIERAFRRAVEEGEPYDLELQFVSFTGSHKWIRTVGEAERVDGKTVRVFGNVVDITERKAAEARLLTYQNQLRELTLRMATAEEQERRRIAVDFHDRIGQNIATLRVGLQMLRRAGLSEELSKVLEEALALLKQMGVDSRSLAFELCPPLLYEMGLGAAIGWLVESFSSQHGVRFLAEGCDLGKSLRNNLGAALFQATRELLRNAVAHAQATKITVSIVECEREIQIVVTDDGAGFDASRLRQFKGPGAGFGLFGIRERLGYFGGRMDVQSEPGRGTVVTMVAPLGEGQ